MAGHRSTGYRFTGYRLNNGLSLYGRAIALRARSWGCGRPWLAMTKVWPTMAGHYSFCKSAQLLQLDSIRKVVGTRLRGFYSFVLLQVLVRPAHVLRLSGSPRQVVGCHLVGMATCREHQPSTIASMDSVSAAAPAAAEPWHEVHHHHPPDHAYAQPVWDCVGLIGPDLIRILGSYPGESTRHG